MSDSASRENSGQRSRWPWFLVAGCLLITLVGLFLMLFKNGRPAQPDSADVAAQASATRVNTARGPGIGSAGLAHGRSNSEPARTAEEIVANKVSQFARSRREIAHAMAQQFKIVVPADVERFFTAVEAGRWDEIEAAFKPLDNRYKAKPPPHDLDVLWGTVLESLGVAESAHDWPAQKLLDYGEAVLGSLRPGMVYVGGTDPGRFIPTLLNETGDGERHVIVSQNGLAAGSYLDYLSFLYGDRLTTLTHEDSNRAFQDYLTDFQKRLAHDQQFPEEPKQVFPGENSTTRSDGTPSFSIASQDDQGQVSGQVAIMGVNERLLQILMTKNPDLSFALEESFPLKSTYADAAPLGPIMELRTHDDENALTAENAAQSVDYWRATTQQMLSDPEASGSPETLKTWSKMAVGQANLFADRNYTTEAEQTYRLSMEIWPRNIESVSGLSDLLLRNGRAVEARRLVEDFARNNPDLSTALESLRPGIIIATQPTPRS